MSVINQKKKKIDDKSKEFATTENNFGGRGGLLVYLRDVKSTTLPNNIQAQPFNFFLFFCFFFEKQL